MRPERPFSPKALAGLNSLRLSSALGLAFGSLFIAVALAETYAGVATALDLQPWASALVVHTAFACMILACRMFAPSAAAPKRPLPDLKNTRRASPAMVFAPALAVLILALMASLFSRWVIHGAPQPLPAGELAWILYVPLVEEIVFRGGITSVFSRFAPHIWAAWFSSMTFALVHADPTASRLMMGKVGLAIGPFLLGLSCEVLVRLTGRLLPGILFHAACNATVWIFAKIDPRWLDWLGILYS